LLISIDGMHALDFANCSHGTGEINGGEPYCPHLAELAQTGVNYLQALTPRPSDSFPGLVAQITGGTTRSAGINHTVWHRGWCQSLPRLRRYASGIR
jgi:predicted AlkP superfamily pyrophosphatase or phosphodiesterase